MFTFPSSVVYKIILSSIFPPLLFRFLKAKPGEKSSGEDGY
nr:MAG TPA: hypothetical protein [Caudoviricetes sp.]